MRLTPRRIESEELLDAVDAPAADVERSLKDLRAINRWLGGVRIYRKLVARFAPDSIVDLGAGTADLLESVPHVRLRVAVDFKIDHLLHARDRGIHRVVGDALRPPFLADAVDLVTSSHFLHHFNPAEASGLLGSSLRIARRGVAMTDTERHYAPLLFVRLLSALRLVGRITRFDAPASVLQGFTRAEARGIAGSVPAAKASVERAIPFRFAILLWKSDEQ